MRRVLLAAVLALVALLASGCDYRTATPPGEAPLRYRDEIFTGVTRTSDVAYGSAVTQTGQTQTLLLDVYRPTGDTVTNRPAIVWVHGGGFASGTRTSSEIVDQANVFARKGFVNVSISYRLVAGGCSAGAVTEACLRAIVDAKHDALAAVRFLRRYASTYGVDPTRIAIGGTSAGAITALNVGFDATDPGASGNPGFDSHVDAAMSLSGARITGAYTSDDAASLLFHGTNDLAVPYQWAVNTRDGAEDAGLTTFLTTWSGAGHVPYLENRAQILTESTNFLYWSLRLGTAAR